MKKDIKQIGILSFAGLFFLMVFGTSLIQNSHNFINYEIYNEIKSKNHIKVNQQFISNSLKYRDNSDTIIVDEIKSQTELYKSNNEEVNLFGYRPLIWDGEKYLKLSNVNEELKNDNVKKTRYKITP